MLLGTLCGSLTNSLPCSIENEPPCKIELAVRLTMQPLKWFPLNCLQVEEFCQASLNTTALMKEETGMQLLLHAGDLSYARCGPAVL